MYMLTIPSWVASAMGPYGSRPITMEPLDYQRGSNRLYEP